MITKKYTLQLLAAFAFSIAFVALLGWAGDMDFVDSCILSMTQEEYDSIKHELMELNDGKQPSDSDIAHWWADHK